MINSSAEANRQGNQVIGEDRTGRLSAVHADGNGTIIVESRVLENENHDSLKEHHTAPGKESTPHLKEGLSPNANTSTANIATANMPLFRFFFMLLLAVVAVGIVWHFYFFHSYQAKTAMAGTAVVNSASTANPSRSAASAQLSSTRQSPAILYPKELEYYRRGIPFTKQMKPPSPQISSTSCSCLNPESDPDRCCKR